ncbi:hypothetical protein GIB67_023121, partial [Kingdonia uniflora]
NNRTLSSLLSIAPPLPRPNRVLSAALPIPKPQRHSSLQPHDSIASPLLRLNRVIQVHDLSPFA